MATSQGWPFVAGTAPELDVRRCRPKGAYRLLGPLITWMGRRQERRIWASLKHRLEASPAGVPPGMNRKLACLPAGAGK